MLWKRAEERGQLWRLAVEEALSRVIFVQEGSEQASL